jgi:hypothetical protein
MHFNCCGRNVVLQNEGTLISLTVSCMYFLNDIRGINSLAFRAISSCRNCTHNKCC